MIDCTMRGAAVVMIAIDTLINMFLKISMINPPWVILITQYI